MLRLVLINGAPGSGKSTLAQLYAERHPLTLALDVDVVRAMIGGWLEHLDESGLIARELALAMAGAHLATRRDVLVPQFLGRLDFVLRLEELAAQTGAEFIEIALLSDPAEAAARFARRTEVPQNDQHRDAAALQERSGGTAALADMYQRLLDVVAQRPRTRTIHTADGAIGRAYGLLARHLDHAIPSDDHQIDH